MLFKDPYPILLYQNQLDRHSPKTLSVFQMMLSYNLDATSMPHIQTLWRGSFLLFRLQSSFIAFFQWLQGAILNGFDLRNLRFLVGLCVCRWVFTLFMVCLDDGVMNLLVLWGLYEGRLDFKWSWYGSMIKEISTPLKRPSIFGYSPAS